MPISPLSPASPPSSLSPVDAGSAVVPPADSRADTPPALEPWRLDDRQRAILDIVEQGGSLPRPPKDALDLVLHRLPQWQAWLERAEKNGADHEPRLRLEESERAATRAVLEVAPEFPLPSDDVHELRKMRATLNDPSSSLLPADVEYLQRIIGHLHGHLWTSRPRAQARLDRLLRHVAPISRWRSEAPDRRIAEQRDRVWDWAHEHILDEVMAGRAPTLPPPSEALLAAYEKALGIWAVLPSKHPWLAELPQTLDKRLRDDASARAQDMRDRAKAQLEEIDRTLTKRPELKKALKRELHRHEGACTDAWMRTLDNVAAAACCGLVDNAPDAARWIVRTALLNRADQAIRDEDPDHKEVLERAGAMRTLMDLKLARWIDWTGPISSPVRFATEAGLPSDFYARLTRADEWPPTWHQRVDAVVAAEMREGFPCVHTVLEEDSGMGALLRHALQRDPAFIQAKAQLDAQLMRDYEAAQDADPDDIDAGNALEGPHRAAVDAAWKAPLTAVLDKLRQAVPTEVD